MEGGVAPTVPRAHSSGAGFLPHSVRSPWGEGGELFRAGFSAPPVQLGDEHRPHPSPHPISHLEHCQCEMGKVTLKGLVKGL